VSINSADCVRAGILLHSTTIQTRICSRAPRNPNVLGSGGIDQVGGQGITEQVCDRHLRMTVLHPAADFGHRVARQNAGQYGTCRLAAAAPANEQAPSPNGEVEQRDQDEAALGLAAGKVDLGLRVAKPEALVSAGEVLDAVVG
jgi:hypothetical protein